MNPGAAIAVGLRACFQYSRPHLPESPRINPDQSNVARRLLSFYPAPSKKTEAGIGRMLRYLVPRSRRLCRFTSGFVALISGSLFAGVALSAPVIFSAGDFSAWSSTVFVGPAGGQVSTSVATGGNPGGYRSVQTTVANGTTAITAQFDPGFVYDPSGGAITSITSSLDFRAFSAFGQGQTYSPILLIQGGNFFEAGIGTTGVTSSVWSSVGPQIFTVGDFTQRNGTGATLDFSTSGDPITIGFLTANTGGAGIVVGYDNFFASLDVVAAIPAPGTALIVAVSVIVSMAQRRSKPL